MTKQEQIEEAEKAYQAIQNPAWEAYQAINNLAYKTYEAIQNPAAKTYQAIQDPAWEAYQAKIKEIEATEVIIEIEGVKYKKI